MMNERETFNRPPRIIRRLPTEEVEIPTPPSMPSLGVSTNWTFVILSLASAFLYFIVFLARGDQSGNIWVFLPIIVISLLSAGFSIWRIFEQNRHQEKAEQQYTESLSNVRDKLKKLLDEQQRILRENNPDLKQLLKIVKVDERERLPEPRLWERRASDDDFLAVRVGIGTLPSSVKVKPPRVNEFQLTPALKKALDLAEEFREVPDVPITVPLRQFPVLGIASSPSNDRSRYEFVYWLLLQIAVHHSPADVRLAVFWFKERDRQWDWLHRLPHTHPFDDDSYRLLARYDADHEHFQQVVTVLKDEMQQRRENGIEGCPHIVVILDGYDRAAGRSSDLDHIVEVGATLSMSFLCLVPEFRQTPALGHGYIKINDGSASELAIAGPQGYTQSIRTDRATRKEIESVARKLDGLGVQLETRYVLPRVVRFSTVLRLGDLQCYKPSDHWQEIDPDQSWHPVPVGIISNDQALEINLNEGVHGVHGIIAGTTGSGKSEFLLTFLMSLAVRHSPQRLQFLLIDFKGGATFKDLEPLPHTVGMVTDLSGNEATRALIAINSELDRRKRILKEHNVTNIREYRGEAQRRKWKPIANLMIAIDEFDEMVRDYPEFVDELIRVAKQGRSLGVYLLFATQQPSQVKEGLLRNITYRVALRVTAPEDSKAMVGIPDAAYLTTATPGRGYFGVNKQVSIFQSARIKLPYQPTGDNGSGITYIDITGKHLPFVDTAVEKVIEAMQDDRLEEAKGSINRYYSQIAGRSLSEEEQHTVQTELQQIQQSPQQQHDEVRKLIDRLLLFRETELQLITAAMKKAGEKQASIWNPPLPIYLSLGDRRLQLKQRSHLRTVIGLSDDPVTVEQEPVIYNLLSPQNNLIAIGSARSGKTTLLRTLMIGLAYTSTPDELCMYVIDAVGKACGLLPDDKNTKSEDGNKKLPRIPHIADAIASEDLEKIDRLLFELDDTILKRRDWCRRHNTENLAAYIGKRENNPTLPPPPPYILVVIDNIVELGEKFDAFLQRLQQGRPYGIAFAVTVGMEKDIKQRRQLFDMQVVLRVNDPNESDLLLNKKLAAFISEKNPGRAFLRQSKKPMELQIALPILTDITMSAAGANDVYLDIEDELGKTIDEIVHRHSTPQMPDRRLRLLDASIALSQLLAETPSLRVPFARNGRDLQPIAFDFRTVPPDLLIAGGSGSGKSVLLRTLLTSFTKQYSPQEVQFVLIDYTRRTLEPFARSAFAREWQVIVPEVLPQAPDPLSNRSQWKGAQKVIRMATEDTEIGALCLALHDELERRKKTGENTPQLLLIIESLDLVQQEWSYLNILRRFVNMGSEVGFHVIVTATTYTNCISQPLMKAMVQKQQMIVLGKPNDLNQEVISGFKWPKEFANVSFPPGRGVIRLPNVPYSVVQVADVTEAEIEEVLRPYQIAAPSTEEKESPALPVSPSLPKVVEWIELYAETSSASMVPFARKAQDCSAVGFDLATNTPDLIIAGAPRTGKSDLVRVILNGLMHRYRPDELTLVLISYALNLQSFTSNNDFVHPWRTIVPQVLSSNAPNPPSNRSNWKGNETELRIATKDTEMAALCLALYDDLYERFRAGRTTPRIVMVVEDIDLMTTAELSFLQILAPFLERGKALGFHAIVTTVLNNVVANYLSNNPFLSTLVKKQSSIYLGKPLHITTDSIGFRWPTEYNELDFPVGRGVLRLPTLAPTLVQTAYAPQEAEPAAVAPTPGSPALAEAEPFDL